MKAMILAAGLGNRMRPLTDDRPKPLIELAGQPLIDHVIDRLTAAGIEEIVVNVHYQADKLERHLARRPAPRIVISDERAQLLDTGGGPLNALPLLGDEAFIIHNSDSVWQDEKANAISSLIETWDARRMDALLLLARRDRSLGYSGSGDFHLMSDGRLRRCRAGEASAHVFAGVSIASPALFADPPHSPFSLNAVWDRAAGQARLFGLELDGFWMHVGSPDGLRQAEAHWHRRAGSHD